MKNAEKLLCLIFFICAFEIARGKEVILPEVSDVKKILVVVDNNLTRPVKTITNLDQISEIVNFINQQRKGWDKPWYGIPVPSLALDLYNKDKFIGHFGIGTNFFEAQRNGDFWSKPATKQQREHILKLINLPNDLDARLPARKAGKQ